VDAVSSQKFVHHVAMRLLAVDLLSLSILVLENKHKKSEKA